MVPEIPIPKRAFPVKNLAENSEIIEISGPRHAGKSPTITANIAQLLSHWV
jgi:predicted AAA+ superfamily ATPase